MNLNEYLNSEGITTDNLSLLPSVGSVINTKTGAKKEQAISGKKLMFPAGQTLKKSLCHLHFVQRMIILSQTILK